MSNERLGYLVKWGLLVVLLGIAIFLGLGICGGIGSVVVAWASGGAWDLADQYAASLFIASSIIAAITANKWLPASPGKDGSK